jgi:hypothetical protein
MFSRANCSKARALVVSAMVGSVCAGTRAGTDPAGLIGLMIGPLEVL